MIRHLGFFQLIASLICILALQGCNADPGGEVSYPDYTTGVSVTARIADHTYTRAYQEEGRVESGEYYLSYPNTNRDYTLAIVDFDKERETTPGLGLVNTLDGSELKWTNIGGSPVTFYLDNVSDRYGEGMEITFSDGDNPFVAGLFDFDEGTNDLLWGEKSVNTGTKSLGFDLHHNMSRVRVQVQVVHTDNSVGEISLEGAKVEITNLHPRPVSYNRLDGTLGLDPAEELKPVTIVAPESEMSGYGWKEVISDDPDNEVYVSQDIVLPPQSIAEDDSRSRLVITLENGDVYSGILPHAMLIANGDETTPNYPVTLSFLKEYVLTIRTLITETPPELAFMPVWVMDWVDKGDFTLEAHQSGIYSASEFYKLIGYYEVLNEYQLVRYGYLMTPEVPAGNTQKIWLFNFFSSVVLDYGQIYDKMKPGHEVEEKGKAKDFTFSFNNYAVYVKNGEDEIRVSEEELYALVTGAKTWADIESKP